MKTACDFSHKGDIAASSNLRASYIKSSSKSAVLQVTQCCLGMYSMPTLNGETAADTVYALDHAPSKYVQIEIILTKYGYIVMAFSYVHVTLQEYIYQQS